MKSPDYGTPDNKKDMDKAQYDCFFVGKIASKYWFYEIANQYLDICKPFSPVLVNHLTHSYKICK